MIHTNKYIFISYSSKNLNDVIKLVEHIEKTIGYKCWYSDRDLDKSKSDWPELLMAYLHQCDKVLVYLTSDALASGQVVNEIANASAASKKVIPLIPKKIAIPFSFMFFIQKYEFINCYQLTDESAKDILRNRILENCNDARDNFLRITQSKEYKEYVIKVLKHYYGEDFIVNINQKNFGIFCIPGKTSYHAKSIKDYDCLCDMENSQLSSFDISKHQSYINNKWYPEYSNILDGNIRFPNRPGYMLDEILTDSEGCFDKMRVHIGTYAETVFTSHVLEYELYQAYLQFAHEDFSNPNIWKRIKQEFPIRNRIHAGIDTISDPEYVETMRRSLLKGDGRESMLSVQMLVVVKSKRSNKYEVKLIQRSNKVAIKPGLYQFIPSGGFEILNDSEDDEYDEIELQENFSPGCAIFREYLEELFNIPEFEGGGTGSIEQRLLQDPRIRIIEKMMKEGKADLHFLGSIIDLAVLRHELSFVLVFHEDIYSEMQLIANEECKKGVVRSIPIQDFDQMQSIWEKIHTPSAAIWHMFKKTSLYRSLIE